MLHSGQRAYEHGRDTKLPCELEQGNFAACACDFWAQVGDKAQPRILVPSSVLGLSAKVRTQVQLHSRQGATNTFKPTLADLQTDRAVSAAAALRLTCARGQLTGTRPCRHVNVDQTGHMRSRAQLDLHELVKPQAELCLPSRELKRLPEQHPTHSTSQPVQHKPVRLFQSRHQRQRHKKHQRRHQKANPAIPQCQIMHKLPSQARTSQQSLRLQILLVQKLLSQQWLAMLMSCSTRPTLVKTITSSIGCSCWKKAMVTTGCGADGEGLVIMDRPNCRGPLMLLLATRSSRKNSGAAVCCKL